MRRMSERRRRSHGGGPVGTLICITIVLLARLFLAPAAEARTQHLRTRFDGYLVVNEYYDDNVFDYSLTDRTLYDTATVTPQRFGIRQMGDYVTDLALRVDRLWERGRHNTWRLRFRYDADVYARNTFRNYHTFGAEIRHEGRRSYFEASFRWLPKYYLRELYWRPMLGRPFGVTSAAANFTKYSASFEIGKRLARHLHGRTWIDFDRRNYDYPFDERDNNTYSWGARIDSRLWRPLDASLQVELGVSNAAGADSLSPAVVDVSNDQLDIRAGFDLRLDRRGRWVLSPSGHYGHQGYTTTNPLDRYHYKRRDDEYEWGSELTWRPHPHWQPRLTYAYRKGTTTTVPGASDAGAFKGNRVGLQLIHYF